MVNIGQLCVKTVGRDAGRECLIVENLDKTFVMVDGNTRRRKCNVAHLQILNQKAELKEKATHEDVVKALASLGVEIIEKSARREQKSKTAKPRVIKAKEKAGKKKDKKAKRKTNSAKTPAKKPKAKPAKK